MTLQEENTPEEKQQTLSEEILALMGIEEPVPPSGPPLTEEQLEEFLYSELPPPLKEPKPPPLDKSDPKYISKKRMKQIIRAQKSFARRIATQAIKTGIIKRVPCEMCGRKETEMHHPDYAKPLEVLHLCHHCHLFADQMERLKQKFKPIPVS